MVGAGADDVGTPQPSGLSLADRRFMPSCCLFTPLRIRQTVAIKKQIGPSPTGKGTLIGVRIQPDDLAMLDSWIIDDGRPDGPWRVTGQFWSNVSP
jgi:hypothetical protein